MDRPRMKAFRLAIVYTGSAERPDALWRLTKNGTDQLPVWKSFMSRLAIRVDEFHTSDLPPFIGRTLNSPPCVMARYESGNYLLVFPSAAIEECRTTQALIAALRLYDRYYNVDLGFSPR
ncbi:hypothetical protein A3D73_04235 [Candidatus Uhrbacteria bacterium RIFCSPHIGHO2_02_FULL_60_44]|nr:MAG: hypothetical protein A3D73_04235 [Candidatus Uhrbacteria bacterium RIFCSPHIGHO2_02_FULL_60_44]